MIVVERLTYTYPRDHHVLKELSFEIGEGEFWGILGKNGAGKTTLIDLILGMKYPDDGSVKVLEKDPRLGTPNEISDVVFLSQDVALKGDISVREFLDFNCFFHKKYSKEIEMDLLNYFELAEDALIGSLSTGQQKKVQIIAGLAADTKIIIIDEITAVLDPETRYKFFSKIIEFNKERKKTVILATNIVEDLKGRVDKILYINNMQGQVIDPTEVDKLFRMNDES